MKPSLAYLQELFDADIEAGTLTWRRRPRAHFQTDNAHGTWNTRYAGKIAGAEHIMGYLRVTVDNRSWLLHRIIWFMACGAWPPHEIDHLNGIKTDNRITNLRSVDHINNSRNCRRRSDNTSGATGISWFERDKTWMARIAVNGRDIFLGYFSSFESAQTARWRAEKKYNFHPNHGKTQIERNACNG